MVKETDSETPKKKGEAVRLQDGSPGLVNDKGQAYRVSLGLLNFWKLCDGSKTQRELVGTIKRPGNTPEEIEKGVVQLINRLREIDLLE
jgi:hypothetical protein